MGRKKNQTKIHLHFNRRRRIIKKLTDLEYHSKSVFLIYIFFCFKIKLFAQNICVVESEVKQKWKTKA